MSIPRHSLFHIKSQDRLPPSTSGATHGRPGFSKVICLASGAWCPKLKAAFTYSKCRDCCIASYTVQMVHAQLIHFSQTTIEGEKVPVRRATRPCARPRLPAQLAAPPKRRCSAPSARVHSGCSTAAWGSSPRSGCSACAPLAAGTTAASPAASPATGAS